MYPLSGAAREKLAQSHTAVCRMDVLHSGRPVRTLDVVSGSVDAEAYRPVMWNLSSTIVDPYGELTGRDVNDLLNPYDCEVAPYRGVLLEGGGIEYTPLGVYQLTDRQLGDDGSISLTGQDRAIIYQGPMVSSLAISGGTPIEDAIARLLSTRNRGVTMSSWATGFTCGPLLFDADIDVWSEALTLATSAGGQLYHDREGRLIFGPASPTSGRAVQRFAGGDGVLISVKRAEDTDTIKNAVVMKSSKTANDGIIQALAEDTDPTSPTYAYGRYGRRPVIIVNEHISSVEQAQQAATAELVRRLGRSETVTASIVPNAALSLQDPVVFHRPDKGLNERGAVLTKLVIPLDVEAPMQLGTQRSIITRDGQILADPGRMTT